MSTRKKEKADMPVLAIYRKGKFESKIVSVLDREFGRREYESPLIYFNSDRAHNLVIITPDVHVNIMGGWSRKGEKIERTHISVTSNLFPEGFPDKHKERHRLRLTGLDTTHGEGASIECYGERTEGRFWPYSIIEDLQEHSSEQIKIKEAVEQIKLIRQLISELMSEPINVAGEEPEHRLSRETHFLLALQKILDGEKEET